MDFLEVPSFGPVVMYITPSTTTGVACMLPMVLPSSRCTIQAPPTRDTVDRPICRSVEWR